ncbi:MAG: hypothetical protein ACI4AE_01205 [Candidatus Cryptobacteroides sp.]
MGTSFLRLKKRASGLFPAGSAPGFAFAVTCLLLNISCSRNSLQSDIREFPIRFEIAVSPNTKADGGGYLVWAFDSESGDACLDGASLMQNGLLWEPSASFLWQEGQLLDIYAAAPVDRASFDLSGGVCFDGYDLSEGLDLMYVDPIKGKDPRSTSGLVSLNFKRALGTLRFTARCNLPAYASLHIRKVLVEGLACRASFRSIPSAAWKIEGGFNTLTMFDGDFTVGTVSQVIGQMDVIPQESVFGVTLVCDIATGESVLRDQQLFCESELLLGPGKICEYELSVTENLNLKIEKQ